MKNLRRPKTKEQIDYLKSKQRPNEKEKAYVKSVGEEFEKIPKQDYHGKISFFEGKIEEAKGLFGDRVSVDRLLKYNLGKTYEHFATFGMGDTPTEGGNLEERSRTFMSAAHYFQEADETLGFCSTYILKQAECLAGAAYFRSKQGLNDEINKALLERRRELLKTTFGETVRTINIKDPIYKMLKAIATGRIDFGDIKGHLIKDLNKSGGNN